MVRTGSAVSLLVLVIASCGPPPEEPADAPEPPATVVMPEGAALFEGDLEVVGTEPFWSIQIRDRTMTLQRPHSSGDHLPLTADGSVSITIANDVLTIRAEHQGPTLSAGSANWRASGISVTLRPGECSDGMSDRVYPLTAEADVNGERLKGCAYPTGMDLGPPP